MSQELYPLELQMLKMLLRCPRNYISFNCNVKDVVPKSQELYPFELQC